MLSTIQHTNRFYLEYQTENKERKGLDRHMHKTIEHIKAFNYDQETFRVRKSFLYKEESFKTTKYYKFRKHMDQIHSYHIPLIRSPIILWTGRSSPSPPGAFNSSLQSADFAQPGIPENGNYIEVNAQKLRTLHKM